MLTMLFHYEQLHWPWVYSTVVLLLAAIRSVLKEWLDFPFFVAIVAYIAQNFIVNIIDLALFKYTLHFETDQDLVNLFAFKLW